MKNMYINGQWTLSESGKVTSIINPADGTVVEEVTSGSAEEAEVAIDAAREAFLQNEEWKNMTPGERSRLLNKIADLIEERAEEIARIETINQGKLLSEALSDVNTGLNIFRSMASITGSMAGQTFDSAKNLHTMTIREPIGVCALIVPWNYPFYIMAQYTAIILAAGNTLVCKPSEITPLSAVCLFEIFEKAGVPKGVVNLLLGKSSVIGEVLTHSHKVDKVTFIGSTRVGRNIMKASADSNFKSVSLELGGKSPYIVFDDADFEIALDYAGLAIFMNAGQTCTAGSRLLLQAGIYDKFMEKFLEKVKTLKLGSGLDEATKIAPMASKGHMEDVLAKIEVGKAEGASVLCGGKRAVENGLVNGFFVEPTVFADVKNDMSIVQEEIFGPVLTVQRFETEEEAIALANSTIYGLAAGIFTVDGARALRVSRALEAGTIYVNNYFSSVYEAPCSTLKQSGIAEEMGVLGLEGYTKIKQVNISLNVTSAGFF